MIQYNADKTALSYVDATTGQTVTFGPLDGEKFYDLLVIKEAQDEAVSANNAAAVKYHTDLNNFQELINEGRVGTEVAPTKPVMKVVGDDGTVSNAAFVPALPDPVYLNIVPSGSIKSAPATDRTDVLVSLVMTLIAKVDKVIAKVGA